MTITFDHVKLGPFEWELIADATQIKTAGQMDGQSLFGLTRPGTIDILLDPDRPDQAIRETLIHELIHACLWTYGVQIEHDDEEVLAGALASAILEMMRRNPALVRYLMEGVEE